MSDVPITRERLLRILDGQAAKTRIVIAGLDETQLSQPARQDGWTAKEVLAHMAWGHEGMLACVLGQAVPGQEGPFDLDAFNEARRQQAASLSVAEVLAWLEEARGSVRALIEQLDEARYYDVIHTPWMGDHCLGQFLMFPALHEGGHRTELAAWRAAMETPA
ncbi:MAG TPA: DinB family protein [Anaerolineae bacterium]|nr:DinB family protein [Anaerolineae bacterium]